MKTLTGIAAAVLSLLAINSPCIAGIVQPGTVITLTKPTVSSTS
jgi:hypothetical protein